MKKNLYHLLIHIGIITALILYVQDIEARIKKGTYEGIDENGRECIVKVKDYSQEQKGEHYREDGRYSNILKTITLKSSFQKYEDDLIEAFSISSGFEKHMYNKYRLSAQNEISDDRSEDLFLNLNNALELDSLAYYRAPWKVIFGIPIGKVENSCKGLKRRRSSNKKENE